MATTVQYNGIDLGLVRTVKVEQKADYDPSNTDVMRIGNRFNIRSVISPGLTGAAVRAGAHGGPAERMADIRHKLLQPRRAFKYASVDSVGPITLLEIRQTEPNGYALDAENGPKPISCDIVQVSEETWIIDFIIDVAIQDCTAQQLFASNRYETTHDIDETGYSKIVTLGKVFVRSDMKTNPNALRWLITPPLPKGFKRKSSYQVHEDGLSMLYRIEDTEMYLAPPATAMDAEGRFVITAAPPGAILHCQCDVRLEGRKNQSKRQLMESAIVIALRRLEAGGAMRNPANGKPWVESGSCSEELFKNVVNVSLKGRIQTGAVMNSSNTAFNFFSGFWAGFFGAAPFAGGFAVPGGAVPAGIGAGVSAAWTSGLLGGDQKANEIAGKGINAAKAAGQAAAAAAAGDRGNQGGLNAPRGGDDKPKGNGPTPAAPYATIDGMLERFGTTVEGCEQDGTVNPGLGGNIDFMQQVAAAFRDPCVADAFKRLTGNVPNVGAGLGAVGAAAQAFGNVGNFYVSRDIVDNVGYWTINDEFFNKSHTAIQLASGTPDQKVASPSLDWKAQRLGRIVNKSDLAGTLTMTQEKSLPDIPKPAPSSDSFVGWYEAYHCEVEHDFDNFARALPATGADVPAKKVRWANPLRTVRVKWGISKAHFPPEIPMNLGDPNVVILQHKMTLPTMEISGDGKTPIFHTSGMTVYQVLDESTAFAAYPLPPWIKIDQKYMPGPIPSAVLALSFGANPLNVNTGNGTSSGTTSTLSTSGGTSVLTGTRFIQGSGA